MKKLIVILGIICCISSLSCTEDPPTQTFLWKTDPIMDHIPFPIVYCPDPGTNCEVQSCPPDGQAWQLLDEFYEAYDENNLQSFFATYDWEELFPQVSPTLITNIINGTYKVYLDENHNIAIYSPGVGGGFDETATMIYGLIMPPNCERP